MRASAERGAGAAMAVSAAGTVYPGNGGLACSDCDRPLKPNPRRRGTRCRSCTAIALAKDPAVRARANASLRATLSDSDVAARRGKAISKAHRRRMRTDPAYAAERRENGRRLGLSGAGIQRHPAGSPPRVKAGQSGSRTKRRGIPNGYWDDYKRILRAGVAGPDQARAMVADLASRERERRRAERAAQDRAAGRTPDDRIRAASAQLGAACARLAAREARA